MKKELLFTKNMIAAESEIAGHGGRVTQRFGQSVLVAVLPDDFAVDQLQQSTLEPTESLSPELQTAVDAWRQFQQKSKEESPTEGLRWDTPGFSPPDAESGDNDSTTS